jgi:hypothetical protein
MAKVVVERPRTGGDGGRSIPIKGYKKRISRDLDGVKQESMKKPYGYNTKNLNEHLGPLRRFLRSRVGRPWDSVYSEICEHIRITSAVQSHVRDHVDMDVEKNVVMVGREPRTVIGNHPIYREFYVYKGILRFRPHKAYRRSSRRPKPIEINGKQYHLVNDVWFEVSLAPIPSDIKISYWHRVDGDVLFRTTVTVNDCRKRYGRDVYAVAKRSLNGKEIKKLGLREILNGIRS